MFSELYFYRWPVETKYKEFNRTFIIGRIKKTLPKILCGISDLLCIDDLQDEAVECRSQIMPGRSYKRKKLRIKGRTHFNNLKVAF